MDLNKILYTALS